MKNILINRRLKDEQLNKLVSMGTEDEPILYAICGDISPKAEYSPYVLNATISNIKNAGESVGEKLNKREESILELIRTNPHITIEQLSALSNVSTRTVERNIRSLKKKDYLERNGSDVKGEW